MIRGIFLLILFWTLLSLCVILHLLYAIVWDQTLFKTAFSGWGFMHAYRDAWSTRGY